MQTIIFDLTLDEPSEEAKELIAYRSIGSVQHLKRLRQQEIRRRKLLRRAWWAFTNLAMGVCFALGIYVLVFLVDLAINGPIPSPVELIWNFLMRLF